MLSKNKDSPSLGRVIFDGGEERFLAGRRDNVAAVLAAFAFSSRSALTLSSTHSSQTPTPYQPPSASEKKPKSKNDRSSSEGLKRPKGSMTSLDMASLRRQSVYEIGPQSWIKEINKNTLEKYLVSTLFPYRVR